MFEVSVVIPCFNVEKYISSCIESVLSQNFNNYEIILVDDGSTDNTYSTINYYLSKYTNKIKYIYQENKGLSGARNTGIRNSLGEYIVFLDADDLLTSDSIFKRFELISKNNNIGLVFGDSYIIIDDKFEAKTFKNERGEYFRGYVIENLAKINFIPMPTVMVRKNVFNSIGLFDEKLKRVEDYDMWIRIAAANWKFDYIDEPIAYYRIRKDSLASNIQEMRRSEIIVLEKVINSNISISKKTISIFKNNLKKLKYHYYLDASKNYLIKGDYLNAKKSFKIVLVQNLLNLKYHLIYILLKLYPAFLRKRVKLVN